MVSILAFHVYDPCLRLGEDSYSRGPGWGGSPCRMSIIRNSNVALSNLRYLPVTLSNLRKPPVALLNLRKPPVACH